MQVHAEDLAEVVLLYLLDELVDAAKVDGEERLGLEERLHHAKLVEGVGHTSFGRKSCHFKNSARYSRSRCAAFHSASLVRSAYAQWHDFRAVKARFLEMAT